MSQPVLKAVQWICLLLLGQSALAGESGQLEVSAIVPPRPCQYPERCDAVEATADTRVTVEDGVIRYIGSAPSVTQSDDVIFINF